MTNLQQVHVRINDAATGKPTPCRVRFTDTQGTYYAPLGRLTEFATGFGVDVGGNVIADGKKYAHIDGTCEIGLPPGKLLIEVHKGFEYKPLHEEIQLQPGKLSLRLTLERWINMRAEGWYSGDTRCHFLTPHGALLEGMAEDLAVVNLLAMECQIPQTDDSGERVTSQTWAVPNILAFSGQQPVLETPGHMVVVNTLNWHPWLGRLALLNCHRVVYPMRFGAPGNDDWTLSDWCDQCHRKGGLVVWTEGVHLRDVIADAILGKIDAFEVNPSDWDDCRYGHAAGWLSDIGIRLAAVGGSGKASNAQSLGEVRTYAQIEAGEQFAYAAWIEAIRKGRTFVTKGPILKLEVNGQGPGETLSIPRGSKVQLHVEAKSTMPFHCVEVVFPGGRIAAAPRGSHPIAFIDQQVDLDSSGNIWARCCPTEDKSSETAFTSTVRVDVEGRPLIVSKQSLDYLQGRLNEGLNRLDTQARFANDAQRQRLRKVFEDAIEILYERAGA